jgi:hypothetical protein
MACALLGLLPMRTAFAIAACAALVAPLPCSAQEGNSFAVGGSYTHRMPTGPDTHGNGGVGLKWRIGHSKTGWGWEYGLGWFTTDLERTIGGTTVEYGEFKVRPFVGGYGYTHPVTNRLSLTADVVGGLAFTSFELHDDARAALRALGEEPTGIQTGMIPVVRPEVSAWYDINQKFGVSVGAGYVIARPEVTLTSPRSTVSQRLRLDTFTLSGGLVYRIR